MDHVNVVSTRNLVPVAHVLAMADTNRAVDPLTVPGQVGREETADAQLEDPERERADAVRQRPLAVSAPAVVCRLAELVRLRAHSLARDGFGYLARSSCGFVQPSSHTLCCCPYCGY